MIITKAGPSQHQIAPNIDSSRSKRRAATGRIRAPNIISQERLKRSAFPTVPVPLVAAPFSPGDHVHSQALTINSKWPSVASKSAENALEGTHPLDESLEQAISRSDGYSTWGKGTNCVEKDTSTEHVEPEAVSGLSLKAHTFGGDISLEGRKKKRELEKEEVRASRKECAIKARQRKAAPIVDLVGMTAPLIIIMGISLAGSGP